MKKLKTLIILLLFPLFMLAQNVTYLEANIGLANIREDLWFPGTSCLIGYKTDLSKELLLDMEAGIALPSILTAKIGLGTYIHKKSKFAIVAGIRPWPLHLYVQTNLPSGKKGQWIIALEKGDRSIYSFLSNMNVNIGYRWNINKKKNNGIKEKDIDKHKSSIDYK